MSWSSTRPRRKTVATTRLKQMVASRWLNSWCRVSVSTVWNTCAHSYSLLVAVWPCFSCLVVFVLVSVSTVWNTFVSDECSKCTFTYPTSSRVALPLLACCLCLGYRVSCHCQRHSAKVTTASQVHMPAKVRRRGPYFSWRAQVCTRDPVCLPALLFVLLYTCRVDLMFVFHTFSVNTW